MMVQFRSPELGEAQFEQIKHLMHRLCGVYLRPGKEALVKARLSKRLRTLGIGSFESYVDLVERDTSREELTLLIDALTTNKTDFFREPQHFDYLREQVLPGLMAAGDRMRFWSAGCSTGEEPYSLAILLREEVPDINGRDVRILGTDISTRVLQKAREAVYGEDALKDVPHSVLKRHFHTLRAGDTSSFRVDDAVRTMVRFARLNLMGTWPMAGPFDGIFCRNVMIYFDRSTQQALIRRFYDLLKPGGHLLIGHSESLTGKSHPFRHVQPTVYAR